MESGWFFVALGLGVVVVILTVTIVVALIAIVLQGKRIRTAEKGEKDVKLDVIKEEDGPLSEVLNITEETVKIQKG